MPSTSTMKAKKEINGIEDREIEEVSERWRERKRERERERESRKIFRELKDRGVKQRHEG